MKRLVALATLPLALALAGCSGEAAAPRETSGSFRGLVTTIGTERNDQLVVFSVRADDGATQSFQYETGPAQPLDTAHLREHMDRRLPVTVEYTRTGNARGIARRILD